MIELKGRIKDALIENATAPHGGGLGIRAKGTISEIKAELITPTKEQVDIGMIFGVLATKKICKKIGISDNGKGLKRRKIEIVII